MRPFVAGQDGSTSRSGSRLAREFLQEYSVSASASRPFAALHCYEGKCLVYHQAVRHNLRNVKRSKALASRLRDEAICGDAKRAGILRQHCRPRSRGDHQRQRGLPPHHPRARPAFWNPTNALRGGDRRFDIHIDGEWATFTRRATAAPQSAQGATDPKTGMCFTGAKDFRDLVKDIILTTPSKSGFGH